MLKEEMGEDYNDSLNDSFDESVDEEPTNLENDTPKNEEVYDEPTSSESDKTGKSDKEIKSLLAQKEHWRKKALEANEKPKATPLKNEDEWKAKVEFLLENRDVTEEEFDHLATAALRRAGSVSIDALREAQKKEQEYISFRRKQIENKKKVPGSTATGSDSRNKSHKEIASMSQEDFMRYEQEQSQFSRRGI